MIAFPFAMGDYGLKIGMENPSKLRIVEYPPIRWMVCGLVYGEVRDEWSKIIMQAESRHLCDGMRMGRKRAARVWPAAKTTPIVGRGSVEVMRRFIPAIGIGMPLCWNIIIVSCMEGFVPLDGSFSYSGLVLRVGVSGTMAVFLLVGSLMGLVWKTLDKRPWLVVAASVSSFVGSALLYLATVTVHNGLLVLMGLILSSAGNAFLMLSWGEYFTRVRSDEMALNVAASFCFSFAVIASVLAVGNRVIAVSVTLLLPLASGAIRIKLSSGASKAVAPRQEVAGSFFWKMMAALFYVGLAYGFARALGPWGQIVQASKVEVSLVGFAIFAFAFVFSVLSKKDSHAIRFYRMAVLLVVGGCVFVPLVSGNLEWIVLSAIVAGQILFQTLIWLVNPEIVIRLKSGRFVSVFGWTMAILYGGMFVGAIVAAGLSVRSQVDVYSFAIALFAIGMLVFYLYVFREKDLDRAICSHDKGIGSVGVGVSCEAVETASQQCGLTLREREVMTLLAQGRTVPYIAEALCIAQSTVKTHIRHIYEKMGVGDRQELIDSLQRLMNW